MNRVLKMMTAVVLFWSILAALPCAAQEKPTKVKPIWVQNGENGLNKQRSNETYRFKMFNTYGLDAGKLKAERLRPLLVHICELYGADIQKLQIDSTLNSGDNMATYRIGFADSLGRNSVVYAQKVDEYMEYESFVDNSYQFEFYQLYTLSERDVTPEFDAYELSTPYRAKAMLLSIIPGMGQVYKGQKAKGYSFLGSEVALLGSIAYFQYKKSDCRDYKDRGVGNTPSWASKERAWRNMRNLSISLAGGLYIYQLVDALVTQGCRRVSVSEKQKTNFSLVPMAGESGVGMSLSIHF